MRILRYYGLFALFALIITGCDTLGPANQEATLQFQNNAYVQEATTIAVTSTADHVRVMATAYAAETLVKSQNDLNRHLLATVRAAVPPTQQIVAVSAADQGIPSAAQAGQRYFIKTGFSSSIRQSDGCIETPAIEFSAANTERIYATLKVYNLNPGVVMGIIWQRDGETVFTEQMPIQNGSSEICLWFYIDPSITPFVPGNWSVIMLADGAPLEAPMSFSLTP